MTDAMRMPSEMPRYVAKTPRFSSFDEVYVLRFDTLGTFKDVPDHTKWRSALTQVMDDGALLVCGNWGDATQLGIYPFLSTFGVRPLPSGPLHAIPWLRWAVAGAFKNSNLATPVAVNGLYGIIYLSTAPLSRIGTF